MNGRYVHAVTAWLVLVGSGVAMAGDPPPWADPNLPVRDGLVLWLDASRLAAAWQANDRPPLYHRAALDAWYDASGNGFDMVQRVKDAQPRYLVAGTGGVVRFDGADDFLGLTQRGGVLNDFTLFIVAAPRSNTGGFRALVAAHETGKNDYLTGFNVDMSAAASDRFAQLNVEGKGFGGAVNLMRKPLPFAEFHTLEITSQPGPEGVTLTVDGQPAGQRQRDPAHLRADGWCLGARCYSNAPEPPFVSGFLDGDVAELILYPRVLDAAERTAVRAYLAGKHAGLSGAVALADVHGGRLLEPMADPPPVQLLVPGFTIHELPLELTNINNVRYRDDGKLVALAYDGNIYLLSDTDGDGLEDQAELFWDNRGRLRGPIGIALTPPGYAHGRGVFVASKGKLSLITDSDGDGRADREIVVATGWQEIPQNVDAIGVALGDDGSVWFALGTANYANGYLLDENGTAHYDIRSERGTVLRVAPDFSSRAIVCTGVRFPVSLAFNRDGDLFCTDQEGATWLPNGNPFDELLHIQPGRHYGFPPGHPRHLPGVIDEPSVFDYAPQHQSTCGFLFNDAPSGRPVFGPAAWAGNAILCGESRGKLFRTQLVKTAAGYVAQNQTLACLGMLTVDACLSPSGDLVVACHSGPPDWGTGPQGKGKLYKIKYGDHTAPQPVRAWAAGPQEVRVAFDRALDPLELRDLTRRVHIEHGAYVRPGDRFEILKPPYAVVARQQATPRYDLPLFSAQVTPDARTLVFTTAPQSEADLYAVTLPGLGRPAELAAGELRQVPAIDVGYDLSGTSASWAAASGAPKWSGWLPHLDLAVSRALTVGSAEHDRLWPLLAQPGTLTLRAQLELWSMLHPAVQPGAQLDYTPPPERVTLRFHSSHSIRVRSAAGEARARANAGGFEAELTVTPRERALVPIELALATGDEPPELELAFWTNEDARPRALAVRRVLVPWATAAGAGQPARDNELAATRDRPELKGGDWARGRAIYFSETALCAKCHRLNGQGGRIGPDLGNLPHRDYASVLRDILEPSAAINPDHISYTVALKDGRVLAGVPLTSEPDRIVLGDSAGKEITVPRADVAELKPSSLSVMPADMGTKLNPAELRDLITFLLTEPLEPARLERRDAPAPRHRAELEAAIASRSPAPESTRQLLVVLVAGPKDHGPDEHDYPLWQSRWAKLLALGENVQVATADGWPTPEQLKTADLVAFYSANPAWTAEKGADLDAFLDRGGGLVFIHFAVNGGKTASALAHRIGLAADPATTKFRHGALDLRFPDPANPITQGVAGPGAAGALRFVDESYWNMVGDPAGMHVLASAIEEDEPRPLVWTREQGKGRVFVSIPGHYTWTFDDPLFRVLLLRGMMWAAHEPVDRLTELAPIGARILP